MKTTLELPTRPYDIIGALNRAWLAQGSIRTAMLAADADYNGHAVYVEFNEYRQYWVARYTWAGHIVLARGTFGECLRAAKREYDRGALGARVTAYPRTEAEIAEATALGFTPVAHGVDPAWMTWKHRLVGDAIAWERHFGGGATAALIAATSPEDYEARKRGSRSASR